MSVVTSVILTVGSCEDASILKVQQWLTDFGFINTLKEISNYAGGSKAMQCRLWCGAFNYMDNAAFIDRLSTISWEYPENVVCVVHPEQDSAVIWRPEL